MWDRDFVIERMDVHHEPKPLLYGADGTPLKRPIGFAMSQTSGTFPELSKPGKKKSGKKRA